MVLCDAQRQFLNGVRFAVVSTINAKGLPHQTVMWYALEGDHLLLSTPRDSLKHKHLKHDPRLSVCVEDHYTYVTLTGTVTLDEEPHRARADYQRLHPLVLRGDSNTLSTATSGNRLPHSSGCTSNNTAHR